MQNSSQSASFYCDRNTPQKKQLQISTNNAISNTTTPKPKLSQHLSFSPMTSTLSQSYQQIKWKKIPEPESQFPLSARKSRSFYNNSSINNNNNSINNNSLFNTSRNKSNKCLLETKIQQQKPEIKNLQVQNKKFEENQAIYSLIKNMLKEKIAHPNKSLYLQSHNFHHSIKSEVVRNTIRKKFLSCHLPQKQQQNEENNGNDIEPDIDIKKCQKQAEIIKNKPKKVNLQQISDKEAQQELLNTETRENYSLNEKLKLQEKAMSQKRQYQMPKQVQKMKQNLTKDQEIFKENLKKKLLIDNKKMLQKDMIVAENFSKSAKAMFADSLFLRHNQFCEALVESQKQHLGSKDLKFHSVFTLPYNKRFNEKPPQPVLYQESEEQSNLTLQTRNSEFQLEKKSLNTKYDLQKTANKSKLLSQKFSFTNLESQNLKTMKKSWIKTFNLQEKQQNDAANFSNKNNNNYLNNSSINNNDSFSFENYQEPLTERSKMNSDQKCEWMMQKFEAEHKKFQQLYIDEEPMNSLRHSMQDRENELLQCKLISKELFEFFTAIRKDNYLKVHQMGRQIFDVESRKEHLLNKKDSNGQTCLHIAAKRGNAGILANLIEMGADPTICDELGRKPIHLAEKYKHKSVIQALYFWEKNGHIQNKYVIKNEDSQEQEEEQEV